MKILVLSDLHNDHVPFEPFVWEPSRNDRRRVDEDADVVVLAGDIDEGVRGLVWARDAFPDKPVIYVAGNHEFYGQYWNKNLKKSREKAAELGIHFLENDALELGGVRFLGCSLWTDFKLFGEDVRHGSIIEARERMNDYVRVKLDRKPGENQDFRWAKSRKLIPQLTMRRHAASAAWLEERLTEGDPAKTVVVTHHAPHRLSIPAEFEKDLLSPGYASDLTRLLGRSAVWIHGHVHNRFDYQVNGTRIVCNPRGYSTQKDGPDNKEFDPALIVEV